MPERPATEGMSKGSSFERQIAKRLSKWWCGRDDAIWRTSQSGGRATQRAKKGKRTAGSYGDLTFTDPIAEPLFKFFTIELKRGRSHGCPGDLIDAVPTRVRRPFERCLTQAIDAYKAAGSKTWLLICRRDRRVAVAYMEASVVRALGAPFSPPWALYALPINQTQGRSFALRFVGIPLESFLKHVRPEQLK